MTGFTGPYALVEENFTLFQNYGNVAYTQANGLITNLTQFNPTIPTFDTTFDYAITAESPDPPEPPPPPDVNYTGPDGQLTGSITATGIPTVDALTDTIPDVDTFEEAIVIPPITAEPPDPITIADVIVPTGTPSYNSPGDYTLLPYTAPPVPGLSIPRFDADDPQFMGQDAAVQFRYNEGNFTSPVKDNIESWINEVLGGDTPTGLPAAVEDALFARALDREEDNYAAAKNAAYTDSANRGFSMPTGALNNVLRQLRTERYKQRNALSREILIQQHNVEIENLRYYTAQAITYQGQLIELFNAIQDRALRAAVETFNAALGLYNAKVALYNADVARYNADVNAYRVQVEAEVEKVNLYRARIEAEQAKAQVNQAIVAAYEAEVRAATLEIEAFIARVRAAQVAAQANQAKAATFAAQVDAYRAEVQGQAEAVRAEVAKIGLAEGEARIFQAKAQGVAAIVGAKANVQGVKADIGRQIASLGQLQLSKIQAEAASLETRIRAATAEVEAKRANAEAYTTRYRADVAKYETDARLINVEANLQRQAARDQADVAIANSGLAANALTETNRAIVAARTAAGNIAGSLASASLSAIGVSASVSGLSSDSINYNYSGTV